MRARTHEQLERKNQLLFYYSKEDITEMLIDAETIIDALNYKIKMKEEEIEKLENVIVGIECDVEILSEQIEDDCIAHEEANKYYSEAHELAIENARLKKKIPSIIINGNYEWTLVEKGKDGVCVNYKMKKGE